jgi:hypothetical protein
MLSPQQDVGAVEVAHITLRLMSARMLSSLISMRVEDKPPPRNCPNRGQSVDHSSWALERRCTGTLDVHRDQQRR